MLCWLDYNYWMEDNKKSEVDKISKEKYIKSDIEKREEYNSEKIFKNKHNDYKIQISKEQKESLELVEYSKQKWYKKIFERILKFFRK